MLLIRSEASDRGEAREDGVIWHDKHIIHFGGDDSGYSSSSSSDSSNSNNPPRTRRDRARNNLNSRVTQQSSNLSSLRSLSPLRTKEATTASPPPPPQQRIYSENLHLSTRNVRARYQRLLHLRLRDLQTIRSEHAIEQVPNQSSRQSALMNGHHSRSRRRRDTDSSQSRSTRTRSNGSNAISRNHQSDNIH